MTDIPDCNEDRSDKPGTEGARGHRWVIVVINHSTDLGVWRVLVKYRSGPEPRLPRNGNTHDH